MEALDLSKLDSRYAGQWVAMTRDRTSVIAHGKDMLACQKRAIQMGYSAEDLIFSRIFKKDEHFVGGL